MERKKYIYKLNRKNVDILWRRPVLFLSPFHICLSVPNILLCLCVSVFDEQEWPWTLKGRRGSVLCGALHWLHQSLAPCRFVHILHSEPLSLSLLNPNFTSLHEFLPRVSVAWLNLKQLWALHSSGWEPGSNLRSTAACVALVSHPECVSGTACFSEAVF